MINLISRWKLKSGLTADLKAVLDKLASEVEKDTGTLMYRVNVQARNPLSADGAILCPSPVPPPNDTQTEVIFIEAYRDAHAFHKHVNSKLFLDFVKNNLHHFYTSPDNPKMPQTITTFLSVESAFTRQAANTTRG